MRRISLVGVALAGIASTAFACQTYSPAQIADAVRNSSTASQDLKDSACTWGGAAAAESGGNTCAHNARNFGVLQLSLENLRRAGISPSDYMNLSLQQQVDVWAQYGAKDNNSSSGFKSIQAVNGGTLPGGRTATDGLAAACSQFGGAICKNDLNYMASHGGQCPEKGNGDQIVATGSTLANGTANADGKGQTICSWGSVIQSKINASGCNNQKSGQNDCPQSPTQDTGTPVIASGDPLPSAASQPTLASSDIIVSPTQI